VSGYHIAREDGLWYIETTDRGSWWTVSDGLDLIINHVGRQVSASGPTGKKLIRALVEHIDRTGVPDD
jgi:hypothetical protein